MKDRFSDIPGSRPAADTLWNGAHKIPWNVPDFSKRILREHLSQDHHLASRKAQVIRDQVAWLRNAFLTGGPRSVLDLGCGPGLYATGLARGGNRYLGIDFSPASVEYARTHSGVDGQCEFRLGNVLDADFGGPHDLVMMLYGELNVFSPDDCRRILSKAFAALSPGGTLLVEPQHPDAVRRVGEGPRTWTRADRGGLFADEPYRCLTENFWYQEQGVALQCFRVVTDRGETVHRSTTKAWTRGELAGLLAGAGFGGVVFHDDWPVPDKDLMALSARRA